MMKADHDPFGALSPYRLAVEGKEYFIGLLPFHRRLRALHAIESKVGEFEPEFVGKMQFCLAVLDAQVRQANENPSIGIILCKEKTRTIVEYALHNAKKLIGVATYEITRTLSKKLRPVALTGGHCPPAGKSVNKHQQAVADSPCCRFFSWSATIPKNVFTIF